MYTHSLHGYLPCIEKTKKIKYEEKQYINCSFCQCIFFRASSSLAIIFFLFHFAQKQWTRIAFKLNKACTAYNFCHIYEHMQHVFVLPAIFSPGFVCKWITNRAKEESMRIELVICRLAALQQYKTNLYQLGKVLHLKTKSKYKTKLCLNAMHHIE